MKTQTSLVRSIRARWLERLLFLGILSAATLCAQDTAERLGRGINLYNDHKYTEAIQELKAVRPLLPKLADYTAFYLASANAELKNFTQVRADLAPFRTLSTRSPFEGRAAVLEANAATGTGAAAEAIEILRARYESLPQPAGDYALAEAYAGAGDRAHAASYYQRVYHLYPATQFAVLASKAMDALKAGMGDAYPPPMPRDMLERGARLLAARDYARARAEFSDLVPALGGAEREIAAVRIGAADYLQGKITIARGYLQSLNVTSPEAQAERLYYLAECARRLDDEAAMLGAIDELSKLSPDSPWRLKALISAGNRFLLDNRPADYEPLYRACYQSFPAEAEAAYCHWKVTWSAYLQRREDAAALLREQVSQYPFSSNTSGALYFLGRVAETSRNLRAARAYYDRVIERYPGFYYAVRARERMALPAISRAAADPAVVAYLLTVAFPERKAPGSYDPTPETARRVERFKLLSAAGLTELAEAELRFGARNDAQPHVLAMEMARSADAPHQGLRNMKSLAPDYLSLPPSSAPGEFWELLFPLPFRDDLVRQASAFNLDPHIVAGLIRQESEFNPRVVSRKKAYGLTQILPSTGRQLARQAGIRPFSTPMLFQPATNLKLGTRYLRRLLDKWEGKWEMTLAAYNAGPSRVSNWITWGEFKEPAEFVETIPFTETREYVQSVLRNAAAYRRIYGERLTAAVGEGAAEVDVQKVSVKPVIPRKAPAKRTPRPLRKS